MFHEIFETKKSLILNNNFNSWFEILQPGPFYVIVSKIIKIFYQTLP
jgi:hypothetical protein